MSAPQPTDSIAHWLTKLEAAGALNVSVKTIENYVAAGRLEQRKMPQVNKPARAVISPASVERMIAEREALATAHALPAIPTRNLPEPLLEALSYHSWPPPLYLTTAQAVRYSGLSVGYLGGLVGEGKLRRVGGMRGWRYRRADLDDV